jgi:large subunit ribosomal protein L24
MVKRHQKPQQAGQRAQQAGGVIEKEGPIHMSNVMLADPKDGKPTRVRIELIEGKRHRVATRSGARID